MREKIHPTWYPEAKMICTSCGTEWIVGSTVPERRLDVCANCHPFYTGEQRIVDTEGQVDRFYRRLQQRDEILAQAQTPDNEGPSLAMLIENLELGKRYVQTLTDAGMTQVGQVIERLQSEGDQALLSLSGIGLKVLSDIKRKIRNLGFDLPYGTGEEAPTSE